jgi:CheY-like chemotaxis protein
MEARAAAKVVILDDDGVVLCVVSQLLRDAGFEVATYVGSTDRLNFIADQEPDLVLLDVNMPFLQGGSLFELMKRDGRLQRVPVVFLSSNTKPDLRRLVAETGADGFLQKDELDASFPEKVARILDRRREGTLAAN